MTVIPNSETRQRVIVGVTRLGETRELRVEATGEIVVADEFYIIDEFGNVLFCPPDILLVWQ